MKDNHEKFLFIFHNTYEPNTKKEIRQNSFMILLKIIDAFMENSMGEVMAEYLDLFYNFIDFNNIFKKQMGLAPFNTQENSKLKIDENLMLSKEWVAHVKDSPSLANEEGLLQVVSSFYVFPLFIHSISP